MARSHASQNARFKQSGSQSNSKENSLDAKGDDFANDAKTASSAKGANFAKKDGFSDDWLDDSGTVDHGHDLGPSAQLADGIRDAATSTARAVKQQATAVASEIGHELGKTAEEQVGRGAEAIRGFAGAVEAAGAELEKVSPQLARLVNNSAQKIRNVSSDLSNREINDLVRTATDFARSQPVLFFGAAIVTGFALARFFKSSAQSDTRYAGVMRDDHLTGSRGYRGDRFAQPGE